ncbi:MAG: hypothetical protein LBS69_06325 [Prevotellaceae bacterium]|jgi:chromosomal replication initiation ATPase DnaA|nr:hypothetical protein [Prevotellaceae bacterium]
MVKIEIVNILERVLKLYEVTGEEMKSKSRNIDLQIPRLVFVNIAKKYGWTHKEIGKVINCSASNVTYYLSENPKQKNTVLYRRGYNSMINKIQQDERNG